MIDNSRYSRPIAAAVALGKHAEDRHRFTSKKVLLTGEAEVLATENGAEVARDALMLLIRICPNVSVGLPPDCKQLSSELYEIVSSLAPGYGLGSYEYLARLDEFDAILSVGTLARQDLPWTVINSNGWLARVSSGGLNLDPACRQANPVGALAAACLGVGDVFKRMIRLRSEWGELLDGMSFSLWTYSESKDPGPQLPPEMPVNLLITGAGAIGNGTAHLLSRLPVTGYATVVDKQKYGEENWGTCLRVSEKDIGHAKAKVLASLLAERLTVRWQRSDISNAAAKLADDGPFPNVALNGLDDIDARHSVQKLWPDVIIDGAIGSEFGCQVTCHPWKEDVACLICLFRHLEKQERSEVIVSRATGLPVSVCADAEGIISEEHVLAAPDQMRAWLTQHVGRKVCSVAPAAVAQWMSLEAQSKGFAPSVPFVACFSSCMIITELVRYVTIGRVTPEPRWQLNFLWGPQRGTDFPERRTESCTCVQRARNIQLIRDTRR